MDNFLTTSTRNILITDQTWVNRLFIDDKLSGDICWDGDVRAASGKGLARSTLWQANSHKKYCYLIDLSELFTLGIDVSQQL